MRRSSSTLRMSSALARLVTQSTPSTCSSAAVSLRTVSSAAGANTSPASSPTTASCVPPYCLPM